MCSRHTCAKWPLGGMQPIPPLPTLGDALLAPAILAKVISFGDAIDQVLSEIRYNLSADEVVIMSKA